jgi:hypothetical protein
VLKALSGVVDRVDFHWTSTSKSADKSVRSTLFVVKTCAENVAKLLLKVKRYGSAVRGLNYDGIRGAWDNEPRARSDSPSTGVSPQE